MAYTIIGNNIHSGNRNAAVVFTSTDRGQLKREYMRLAFSNTAPVAPVAPVAPAVAADQPLLKVATAQLAMAIDRNVALEAKVVELTEALVKINANRVDNTQLFNDTNRILAGYTARKNSAAWKAGLTQLSNINEQLWGVIEEAHDEATASWAAQDPSEYDIARQQADEVHESAMGRADADS